MNRTTNQRRFRHLIYPYLGLVLLGMAASGDNASAASELDETRPEQKLPAIQETQVTIVLDKAGQRAQFQATVVGKDEDSLTLLTAAHCLAGADVDDPVRIKTDDVELSGRLGALIRNPAYRPPRPGDIPGADNAFAIVHEIKAQDEQQAKAFEGIRVAELSESLIPHRIGRVIPITIIDQFGAEHVLRAGNFDNPRWLAWGKAFQPVAGDSGSGVFVLLRSASGEPQPLLIGIVTNADDRGGGASLIQQRDRWVAQVLRSEPSQETSERRSGS